MVSPPTARLTFLRQKNVAETIAYHFFVKGEQQCNQPVIRTMSLRLNTQP